MSMLGTGQVASVKLKGHQADCFLTMNVWVLVVPTTKQSVQRSFRVKPKGCLADCVVS